MPTQVTPELSKKASQKIQQARLNLIIGNPFFATLVLKMPPVENEHVTNMATNGSVAYYNPIWVEASTREEVTSVLCALAMHNALGHPWRRDARDPRIWNNATDSVVNEILENCNMPLPAGQYVDSRFIGQPVESIYQTMFQERDENQDGNNPEGDGQGAVQDGQGQGDSDSGGQDLQTEWQIAMVQAAQAAQAAGNLPGMLQRLLDEIEHPPVNWREALADFIINKTASDYTWTKPNRKYLQRGFYLPTLEDRDMPPIWFCVDTSGSIDDHALSIFANEINAAVSQVQPEHSRVIYFDTRVCQEQVFDKGDEILLDPKGGGGTDFRAPYARMQELITEGEFPCCVVFITDLACNSWPDKPLEVPVLFAHYDPHGYYQEYVKCIPEGFGDVITIKE